MIPLIPETKQLLFIQEEELLLQQEELGRGIPLKGELPLLLLLLLMQQEKLQQILSLPQRKREPKLKLLILHPTSFLVENRVKLLGFKVKTQVKFKDHSLSLSFLVSLLSFLTSVSNSLILSYIFFVEYLRSSPS